MALFEMVSLEKFQTIQKLDNSSSEFHTETEVTVLSVEIVNNCCLLRLKRINLLRNKLNRHLLN